MKNIRISYSYPQSEQNSDHLEILDALNELLLDVKHDFIEKNINLDYQLNTQAPYSLTINQKEVDFECHCQEDKSLCQCEPLDKIRKSLYKEANFTTSGCGCGGNCGCH